MSLYVPEILQPLFGVVLVCLLGLLMLGGAISQYDRSLNYWKPHALRVQVLDAVMLWLCAAIILMLLKPDQAMLALFCLPVWVTGYALSFVMQRHYRQIYTRSIDWMFSNSATFISRQAKMKRAQKSTQELLDTLSKKKDIG